MFTHRKRKFLSPASTGQTSYILTEVESSHQGEYKWGTNMLTLADCHKSIKLEFFLGTKKARRQSLTKIADLVTDLVRFASALKKEAELINTFEAQKKPSKRTKKGKKGKK
jgi:hypothetical protein